MNAELASTDVFVPLGGEEPPPDFAPYEAEFFYAGSAEDVVSHDKHLNEDGELGLALLCFLLDWLSMLYSLLCRVNANREPPSFHR